MKNFLAFFCFALSIFAWFPDRSNAEASWWDNGINIFKNLSKDSKKRIRQPTSVEIEEAFKEALRIGTKNVVRRLGAPDGFNTDPAIHIPLPEELDPVKTMLTKIGMAQPVDDLELKLNRAAEAATPKAKTLFLQAIAEMSFDDIKNIYKGPKDSATKYFQKKMAIPLKKAMKPMVERTLSQVGAIQAYDKVIGRYKTLPFVPDVKANLSEYVTQKGMDGIFYYMAKEEAAIRDNPAKQTTELLKKVFGAK